MSDSPSERDVIKKIQEEHDQLRDLFGKIHHALASKEAPPEEAAKLMETLCSELEAHFHNEEEGGFFSEITDEAPRLSGEADKLCHEHQEMLVEAQSLAQRARTSKGSEQDREKLNRDFHDFSKRMMQHESEENLLLQQAFTEDIGSND